MVQLKKQYVRYIIAAVILAAAVLWVIRLNSITRTQLINRTGQSFETGVVVRILQDNIQEDGMRIGQQTVVVRMTSGEKKGEELTTTSSAGYLFGAACTVGMRVVVMQSIAGDSVITSVYSMDRKEVIIGFAVLYLGTLCVIGGKKGIRGALGLAGTLAGVVIAGVAAAIFSRLSGITGWNVSDIESLLTLWQTNNIQVGGLLFSGLLISSLGAVMDVAMSISSSMQELCSQNPEISRLELMRAGMRVGRDMMGTDSNTLILAFAGTSLSMLVLDYAYELPYLQIINSNNIGIAVMQGLSGSFGVVLTVPATVLMAAYIYKGENG